MPSAQIRVNLFGTLTLWRNEKQLDFSGSISARSVLAYLLLHRPHPQPRIKIAGIFWPDMDEARARRALTQALWRIRNVVPDFIQGDTQEIQISERAALWIDIGAFESLIVESAKNAESRSRTLQQSIELYCRYY